MKQKKIFAILLICLTAVCIPGCGSKDEPVRRKSGNNGGQQRRQLSLRQPQRKRLPPPLQLTPCYPTGVPEIHNPTADSGSSDSQASVNYRWDVMQKTPSLVQQIHTNRSCDTNQLYQRSR